jgi:hypothetical protein
MLRHIRIIAQFDPQLGQRPGIADGDALARLLAHLRALSVGFALDTQAAQVRPGP